MKFISFLHNKEAKYGVVNNKLITDLTGKVLKAKTLKELIQKKGISDAKKYAIDNPGNINLFQVHIGNNVLTIFVSEDYLDLILIRNNISGGLLE